MIITLIVVLFLVLIASIILYLKKRKLFERHQGIAEFLAVMISLIFTLLALQQAQSTVDQSTEDFNKLISRMDTIVTNVGLATQSIDSVKLSLSTLPTQIDSFSKSIYLLNEVVSRQRDKLEATLNDFNSSIKGFESSVDNMAKRFNRHPILKINFKKTETDSTVLITHFVITNFGDLIADVYTVRFQIEEDFLISFNLKSSQETYKQGTMRSFQINFTKQYVTPNENTPWVSDCTINIRKGNKSLIKVFIYYTSPFGNDGNEVAEFRFQKKK
jgi:hypothetical protein